MNKTETQIQSQIISYLLRRKDIFVQRTNNITAPNGRGGFKSLSPGQHRGYPDITVIKNGKFIGIEVKKGGKYIRDGKVNKKGDWKYVQSEDQVKMEKMILDAGGEYFVVRSLDEVIEILKE